MRKPSPISTSSLRLTTISLPGAKVSAHSSSAAALLLTTCTASARGTASASAARVPRPRFARSPVSSANSTSVAPPAATIASSAAADSGARPRLVCTRTPVALSTGRRDDTVEGSRATTSATTSPGSISPARARCCAAATSDFTRSRPRVSVAFAILGSPSTASVRDRAARVTHGRPPSRTRTSRPLPRPRHAVRARERAAQVTDSRRRHEHAEFHPAQRPDSFRHPTTTPPVTHGGGGRESNPPAAGPAAQRC